MNIDFTNIDRYDMECSGYQGDEMIRRKTGDWVHIEDVIAILNAAGVKVRTAETVSHEIFEAEMMAKYGSNWKD